MTIQITDANLLETQILENQIAGTLPLGSVAQPSLLCVFSLLELQLHTDPK